MATVGPTSGRSDLPPKGERVASHDPPARPLLHRPRPRSRSRGAGDRLAGQIASFRSPWERWWTEDDAIWPASLFPAVPRRLSPAIPPASTPFARPRLRRTCRTYLRFREKPSQRRRGRADLKGVSWSLGPDRDGPRGRPDRDGRGTSRRGTIARQASRSGRRRIERSRARTVSLLKRSALKGGPAFGRGRFPDLAVRERQPCRHAARCRRLWDSQLDRAQVARI